MSATTRIFSAVWLQDGECPGDKRHFHGAAREVYGYLKYHAQRHGGFVFASVPDITKHTKQWADKNQESFSQRQCERILRAFRDLGVLQPGCVRKIHGRKYRGWQFLEHEHWTHERGGLCEFIECERYEASSAYIMGNQSLAEFDYQQLTKQNVGVNDGANDGANVGINGGEMARNVGANVGVATDVLTSKPPSQKELQEEASC